MTELFPITEAQEQLKAAWNKAIPKQRFQKWTQAMKHSLRALLGLRTLEEILAAVRHYGESKWHLQHRHLECRAWLQEGKANDWCEKAGRAAEDAEWRQRAKDTRVAERTDTLAEALRLKGEDEALLLAFGLRPAFEQAKIFAKANKEIVAIGGRMMPPKLLHLDTHLIREGVLRILRRGAAT